MENDEEPLDIIKLWHKGKSIMHSFTELSEFQHETNFLPFYTCSAIQVESKMEPNSLNMKQKLLCARKALNLVACLCLPCPFCWRYGKYIQRCAMWTFMGNVSVSKSATGMLLEQRYVHREAE